MNRILSTIAAVIILINSMLTKKPRGTEDFNFINFIIIFLKILLLNITNTFNNPPLERKYYYNFPGSVASSGVTVDEHPSYLSLFRQIVKCTATQEVPCSNHTCDYNQYSSNNFYSLYSYGGNHIYYQSV